MRSFSNLTTGSTESRMVELALPHIKKLCYRKWMNLEWEDRLAEASYFFICATRSFPIDSGHFMKDYSAALIPYMDLLNRKAPPRFYKCEASLDQRMAARNGDSTWSLYEILEDPNLDGSVVFTAAFLRSLPKQQQSILRDWMDGYTKAEIARKYGLLMAELIKLLLQIGQKYKEEFWLET